MKSVSGTGGGGAGGDGVWLGNCRREQTPYFMTSLTFIQLSGKL